MKYIKLESTFNTRDLGGYRSRNGKYTSFNQFFRSDHFKSLSEKDQDELVARKIHTIIDLRSKEEIQSIPNVLSERHDVHYENIPFVLPHLMNQIQIESLTLGEFYIGLLKQKEIIKLIFERMSKSEGSILFHCTAGKDRTGVISMLLLMLGDVTFDEIIEDYQVTYELIKPALEQTKVVNHYNEQLMYSNPESIAKAYQYIEKFGGVWMYLRSCELSNEALINLQDRLLSS